MAKYGMVIDLQKCVGCGACALACKSENNTRARANGQSYNWADFLSKTEGTFPEVKQVTTPVLCNHCSQAPCIENCPVTPKAMFKAEDGTTLHNQERCIGCRACQMSCPYSAEQLDGKSLGGESYSVISFNFEGKETQPFWKDKTEAIKGCTASGAEMAKKAKAPVPLMTDYESGDYKPIRRSGVVEKCILCHHRTTHGQLPACVEACPAKARIFGDQQDATAAIAQVLAKEKSTRLKEQEGTEPNVFYVRKYGPRA
ncbi:MAG: 4Fe-4S ferredoxin [Desulfuromonadales bacterium GWD2_61_12]|nr:MAG: 4Fe-4S ferredoxin [Desulfuromonadales bacterium GWC2_61_20]OGR36773.1 MAG: 4Fe-4S ferredoxin [Desulfuromonadales bacterium GWD2_61_12]HAD04151.1 4Fe-4S ferredoxin [Desulfuromonas sp.]HBT83510.1 4Fe-4S ferredoxin [Desulfuromonas sp.]